LRDRVIIKELVSKIEDSVDYSVSNLGSEAVTLSLAIPDPTFYMRIRAYIGSGQPTRGKRYLVNIFHDLYNYDNMKRASSPNLLRAFLSNLIRRSLKVHVLRSLSAVYPVERIKLDDDAGAEESGFTAIVPGVL
jgi:hypothetical protein